MGGLVEPPSPPHRVGRSESSRVRNRIPSRSPAAGPRRSHINRTSLNPVRFTPGGARHGSQAAYGQFRPTWSALRRRAATQQGDPRQGLVRLDSHLRPLRLPRSCQPRLAQLRSSRPRRVGQFKRPRPTNLMQSAYGKRSVRRGAQRHGLRTLEMPGPAKPSALARSDVA